MDKPDENIKNYIQDVAKSDFGVLKKWTNSVANSNEEFKSEMVKLVEYAIRKMINSDMQQLMNILYRADVYERKIKTVLAENPDGDAAKMIAELYVDRMMEKAESRSQYSSKEGSDWSFDC